jgi:hypothetical protein
MRSGRWFDSRGLTLVALALAVVTSGAWGLYLAAQGEAQAPVVALLAVPVVVTAIAVVLGHTAAGDALLLAGALLLVLFVGIFGLSFGLSYLPVAALMAAAVVRVAERRQAGSWRPPGATDARVLPGIALALTCLTSVLVWLDAAYAARQWGAGPGLQGRALVVVLPIVITAGAFALHRSRFRGAAQVTAAVVLLVLVLSTSPAFLFALLYLPAVALLLVSGLQRPSRAAGHVMRQGRHRSKTTTWAG